MSREQPANTDEAEALFSYFNEIAALAGIATRLFEKHLPAGLTQAQFNVLNWFVQVDVESTPGHLAKAFEVTSSDMTHTLKKLADKKFIAIRPNPLSGRQKQVTITPAGLEMRARAISAVAPLLSDFGAMFPAQTLAAQLDQLREIRHYLDDLRTDR